MSPFLTTMAVVALVVIFATALDLFFGGKGLAAANRFLGRRVDADAMILKGLSKMRAQSDREIVQLETLIAQKRLQRLVALIIMAAGGFLTYTIFFR